MTNDEVQKIEAHHGWDYCEHNRVRRHCEECRYQVPAFMRREKHARPETCGECGQYGSHTSQCVRYN
ncbi:MAG: hypothetical protein AB1352_03560 [Patescibacteria group bacterium]